MTKLFRPHAFAALVLVAVLAACSSGGLPVGLTARMDQPGASLDRVEARSLINQFRSSRGVQPLSSDPALDAQAQTIANQYAQTSTRPDKPDNVIHIRVSAGYANFAETFSGWRGQTADANAIADPGVNRMGIAVAYSPNSEFGVHWVLLLAGPSTGPVPSVQTAQ